MKMNCYYLAIFVYIMNNEVRRTNRLGQVFPHYFSMRYCLLFCQLRIDFHDQRCVSVPHPGLKRFNGNPGKVCLSTEINPEIMTANSNLAPWWQLLPICQHSFTLALYFRHYLFCIHVVILTLTDEYCLWQQGILKSPELFEL